MLDDPRHNHRRGGRISRADQLLIEEHLAEHGVTVCPPMTHARAEWQHGPSSWRQQITAQFVATKRRHNGGGTS